MTVPLEQGRFATPNVNANFFFDKSWRNGTAFLSSLASIRYVTQGQK
jgi:hypothetical protein